MLSLFTKPTQPEVYREPTQDERAALYAARERAARAKEPEVLARIPAEMALNEADHKRQVAGYKFECRRYGDFLALFMERPVAAGNEGFSQGRLTTSVNIAATRELRLNAGRAPDLDGVVRYHVYDGKGDARPDYIYCINTAPPLFSLDIIVTRDSDNCHYYEERSHASYRTLHFPRPAADDRIRFEGIGATIFAPFGCGQAVYDAILKEIEVYREGRS